jgi:hypothetical protein
MMPSPRNATGDLVMGRLLGYWMCIGKPTKGAARLRPYDEFYKRRWYDFTNADGMILRTPMA